MASWLGLAPVVLPTMACTEVVELAPISVPALVPARLPLVRFTASMPFRPRLWVSTADADKLSVTIPLFRLALPLPAPR